MPDSECDVPCTRLLVSAGFQPCPREQAGVSILRCDPPLEYRAARAPHRQQIAIPRWGGGVGGQGPWGRWSWTNASRSPREVTTPSPQSPKDAWLRVTQRNRHMFVDNDPPRLTRINIRALSIAWAGEKRGQVKLTQLKLHPPGLDLRQVQDVVDQRQQVVPRGVDVLEVLFLLSFSSSNMRSVRTSENAMIAFKGVLNSWDMLARNSDLCWLATSSCRLLSSISRNRRAF